MPERFLMRLSMRELEAAIVSFLNDDESFRRIHDPDGTLPVCFTFVVNREDISVKVYRDD
jgi:hypothetical protein